MNTHTVRSIAFIASLAVAFALIAVPARAQAPPAPPSRFPDVVGALRTTPGCLGVETGQTSSGKRVIFAWFENKKALVDWYNSDTHQKAIKAVFPDLVVDRQPLPDLPEDSGPILTIVSVKFSDGPAAGGAAMPIASIGIELYGPLPGGIAVGARFAPASLKVKGLREIQLGATQPPR